MNKDAVCNEKDAVWTVTPVLTGRFGMVRDDIRFRGGDPAIASYVPSVLFLLYGNGKQVVVDTGFGDPGLCAEEMSLFVEREKPYDDIMMEAGITRNSTEAVIFTHLHWDHAGMADWFLKADYYCHEKELDRALANPEEYPPVWMNPVKKNMHRMHAIQGTGRHEILPGLWVEYTGGHTFGSMMVIARTEEGMSIITGDAVMTFRNIREKLPVGLCVNSKECETVFKKIGEIGACRIYPSHDMSLFER